MHFSLSFGVSPAAWTLRICCGLPNAKTRSLCLSTIHLGEIFYTVVRKLNSDISREIPAHILQLPISRVEARWVHILAAAEIKSKHPISFTLWL